MKIRNLPDSDSDGMLMEEYITDDRLAEFYERERIPLGDAEHLDWRYDNWWMEVTDYVDSVAFLPWNFAKYISYRKRADFLPSDQQADQWDDQKNASGNSLPLEQRLALHEKRIADFVLEKEWKAGYYNSPFLQALPDPEDMRVLARFYATSQSVVQELVNYSPFWVRSPRSWKGETLNSLINHVFILYDVPLSFNFEGLVDYYDNHCDYRREDCRVWFQWFIIIVQGGSLKRADRFFNWNIPGKLKKFLFETPYFSDPRDAALFAEVLRLGGTKRDFERIRHYKPYNEGHVAPDGAAFLLEVMKWLITHGDELTDSQTQMILEWSVHRFTEAQRYEGNQPFSWKKRALYPTLVRAEAYREAINNPQPSARWSAHGWDCEKRDEQGNIWMFKELTSGQDLYEEGQALHHCVGTYAADCVSGASAIISLRRNDKRTVTIEIQPGSTNIIQIYGKANRSARPDEQNMIERWHTEKCRKNETP